MGMMAAARLGRLVSIGRCGSFSCLEAKKQKRTEDDEAWPVAAAGADNLGGPVEDGDKLRAVDGLLVPGGARPGGREGSSGAADGGLACRRAGALGTAGCGLSCAQCAQATQQLFCGVHGAAGAVVELR